MRGNGSEVRGTLIVRGALHQTYEEDEAAGEWVTKIEVEQDPPACPLIGSSEYAASWRSL